MKKLLFLLLGVSLNVASTVGCSQGGHQMTGARTPSRIEPTPTGHPALLNVAQDSREKGQKTTDEVCDFSKYSPVRISHFVPKATVKRVMPKYPEQAVRLRIQGYVMVKVLVNMSGEVEKACAYSGDATLRGTAEDAASRWKFKPNFGFRHLRSVNQEDKKSSYVMDSIVFNFVLGEPGPGPGFVVRP